MATVKTRGSGATCAITKAPVRGGGDPSGRTGRIFAELRTRTRPEAIASWLGSRPTR